MRNHKLNLRQVFLLFFFAGLITFLILGISPIIASDMESMSAQELSQISGREGIKIEVEDWENLSIDQISLTDPDGYPGGGGEGSIRLGNGDDGAINLSTTNNLSAFTLDADETAGIVLGLPGGSFNLSINETFLGTGGTTFGVELFDVNMNQPDLQIQSQ